MSNSRFTAEQLENLAKVELLLRRVRNLQEWGSHPIRAMATDANRAFEKALEKDYPLLFKTKTWKSA